MTCELIVQGLPSNSFRGFHNRLQAVIFISDMGTKYAIGIDPHAYNIKAVLFDIGNRTKEIKRFNLEPCEDDYKTFFDFTSTFKDVDYCIENAKGLGKSLSDYLLKNNANVFDIHPGYTADYKKKDPNIEKSDWNDCKYIVQAYLIESNIKQLKLNLKEEYYQELDDLSFQRWQLGQEKGDTKKKIGIRLYKRLGANYKKFFTNKFWSKGVIKELEEMFRDKNQPDELIIKMFISDLNRTEGKIAELDEILEKFANDEVKKLREIKGCGFLIASRLISEIKKGKRPKNCKSLAKWAGIAPLQTSTGGKTTHRCNYRGNRHLNYLIHQVCVTKLQLNCKDTQTKDYYNKRIKAGDSKNLAFRKVKNVVSRGILKKIYDFGEYNSDNITHLTN